MKSKISKFYKQFRSRQQNSIKSVLYKPVLQNKFLEKKFRSVLYAYSFYSFKKFSNRPKPICLETSRSRGVLSDYFFSRMTFKKYSITGDLPGFKKSRW